MATTTGRRSGVKRRDSDAGDEAREIVRDPLEELARVGASVMILADEETAYKITDEPILLKAICGGTHTLRTADRRHMPILRLPNETDETYKDYFNGRRHEWPGFSSFLASRMAAYLAYNMAGIHDPVEDFDVLETHDAFTISDVQTYEDIGLRPYGNGREFIESGEGYFEGKLPDGTPLISVELDGVCTKLMSWLKEGRPEIGMPVKAVFNTQHPTNTILDLAWIPA